MQVDGSTQTAQMTQMRKMDGSGGGQGKGGGMNSIMQSLSADDQTALKDQMSSLSEEDRVSAVSQMKEVDSTSMSSEDYMDTLLSILNGDEESTDTTNTSGTSVEVYA